jgi:hypothetical protein
MPKASAMMPAVTVRILRVLLDRVLREVDDLPEELRSAIEEVLR